MFIALLFTNYLFLNKHFPFNNSIYLLLGFKEVLLQNQKRIVCAIFCLRYFFC